MKVLHDRRVSGLCVIGLVMFFGASGCGDDDPEDTEGVSETDAGGTDGTDEAGRGGSTGGAGRAAAGRGGAGGASGGSAGAGEAGGAAGEGGASGAGESGTGGSGTAAGAGGSKAEAGTSGGGGDDVDAGVDEGEAGSGGSGEAGSGGAGEAGSGGAGEAGSGGAGEAGSSGAGEAGSGGAGEAGSGGEEARCGTRGGVTCGEAEFCNFDETCGEADRGGVCEDKPEFCAEIFAPVCGCDSRTYGNACEANAAGVSVQREGQCSPEECADLGGRAVFSDGASTPECAQGEESWSLSGGDEPVICCLGEQPSGETCGGIAALDCGDGEFCNYEEEAGGLGCDGTVADTSGVCQERPGVCTREYNPVCGCDRKSYGNPCEAHANGFSILHAEACNEIDCEAVNGRVVFGIGPAPMCDANEMQHTYVIDSSGAFPIEGAICCVPQ